MWATTLRPHVHPRFGWVAEGKAMPVDCPAGCRDVETLNAFRAKINLPPLREVTADFRTRAFYLGWLERRGISWSYTDVDLTLLQYHDGDGVPVHLADSNPGTYRVFTSEDGELYAVWESDPRELAGGGRNAGLCGRER